MSLKVEEVMVKPVITLSVASMVKEAVETMSKREIGCLVILHDEIPIGIITERDIIERVLLGARDPLTTKLSQIMSAPITFGEPKMNIQDAVALMTEKKVKHLPIIHLIDVISGEDEDKVGSLLLQGIDILKNGIGGPLIPVFVNSLLGRNDSYKFSQRG